MKDGFNPFFEQMKETEPEQQQNRKFQFISAYELCSKPVKVSWLIKDYVPDGALGEIFGESGSGKSFLALDWGLSIATKTNWHGHNVKKSGSVFYIVGEGHTRIYKRLRAWAQHNQKNLNNVPFYISDRPAQFLNEGSAAEVSAAVDELVKEHGQPVLIIIDTLARNFGNGDENSTKDMSLFISIVDQTLRIKYQCSVLIVHHTGLSATDRARGNYSLKAALDVEYRFNKNSQKDLILTCMKMKDDEEPPRLAFALEKIVLDGLFEEDGSAITSCVLKWVEGAVLDGQKLTGAKKIAYDSLARFPDGSANIEDWWLACDKNGISTSPIPASRKKAFQRAVSELRDNGWVIFKDDFYYIKNKPKKGGT